MVEVRNSLRASDFATVIGKLTLLCCGHRKTLPLRNAGKPQKHNLFICLT